MTHHPSLLSPTVAQSIARASPAHLITSLTATPANSKKGSRLRSTYVPDKFSALQKRAYYPTQPLSASYPHQHGANDQEKIPQHQLPRSQGVFASRKWNKSVVYPWAQRGVRCRRIHRRRGGLCRGLRYGSRRGLRGRDEALGGS
jgi:hypothetical protein